MAIVYDFVGVVRDADHLQVLVTPQDLFTTLIAENSGQTYRGTPRGEPPARSAEHDRQPDRHRQLPQIRLDASHVMGWCAARSAQRCR